MLGRRDMLARLAGVALSVHRPHRLPPLRAARARAPRRSGTTTSSSPSISRSRRRRASATTGRTSPCGWRTRREARAHAQPVGEHRTVAARATSASCAAGSAATRDEEDAGGPDLVATVSSATRLPGQYTRDVERPRRSRQRRGAGHVSRRHRGGARARQLSAHAAGPHARRRSRWRRTCRATRRSGGRVSSIAVVSSDDERAARASASPRGAPRAPQAPAAPARALGAALAAHLHVDGEPARRALLRRHRRDAQPSRLARRRAHRGSHRHSFPRRGRRRRGSTGSSSPSICATAHGVHGTVADRTRGRPRGRRSPSARPATRPTPSSTCATGATSSPCRIRARSACSTICTAAATRAARGRGSSTSSGVFLVFLSLTGLGLLFYLKKVRIKALLVMTAGAGLVVVLAKMVM